MLRAPLQFVAFPTFVGAQAITLQGLPVSCFPPGEATNKLASLRAKACKAGIVAPFPFVDLTEFLPTWADDTACVSDDYEDMSSDPKQVSKKKRTKLDMVRWVAAFQNYAIAADAANVSIAFVVLRMRMTLHVGCCRSGSTPLQWPTWATA